MLPPLDLLPAGNVLSAPAEFVWYAARRKPRRPAFQWVERRLGEAAGRPPAPVLALRPEANVRAYKPLEEGGLFLTFAATDPTPEGCLAFAERFGPLGPGVKSPVAYSSAAEVREAWPLLYPGRTTEETFRSPLMEPFEAWRDAITRMRHLTDLWQAAERGDRGALQRSVAWKGGRVVHRFPALATLGDGSGEETWGPDALAPHGEPLFPKGDLEGPARLFVQRAVNGELGGVSPRLFWSVGRRRSELTYVPAGLLVAMYFQFAQALDKGWKYRQCPVCLKTFQLAPGVNRANRLTCSITCRTYLYRQRMDKARQMHEAGRTVKQIAKELGANVKTVTGWVTKRKG